MKKKSKLLPFFAISNDELSGKDPLIGEKTRCPRCKKDHLVSYGTDKKTGKVSKLLAFVTCKDNRTFLVAINGKLL